MSAFVDDDVLPQGATLPRELATFRIERLEKQRRQQ
jgi:hypothetical protein